MEFKDYYKVLGVEAGAGEAEIKAAYRRLARKFHPDVSKEAGAEEKFKSVNEAYEVLRDTKKRAAYDQLRTRGYKPGEEFRPPPDFGDDWNNVNNGGEYRFNFDEADGGGGAGFSDFFESLFGARAPVSSKLRARMYARNCWFHSRASLQAAVIASRSMIASSTSRFRQVSGRDRSSGLQARAGQVAGERAIYCSRSTIHRTHSSKWTV